MAATNPFRTALIAPCGMDCAICMAYLRTKNRCQGCHSPDRLHHRNFFLFSCREEKAGFVTLVRGSLPAAQAARYTLQDKIQ